MHPVDAGSRTARCGGGKGHVRYIGRIPGTELARAGPSEQVETGEWCDSTAKEYFSALASDTARATELRSRLGDLTGAANLSAFERAFGPRMTVGRLGVPAVSGYEYLWAPDLIYPHIRTFLEGLAGGDP